MSVSECIRELVLAAGREFAAADDTRQKELKSLGNTGLPLAVRPPSHSDCRAKFQPLRSIAKRSESVDFNPFDLWHAQRLSTGP